MVTSAAAGRAGFLHTVWAWRPYRDRALEKTDLLLLRALLAAWLLNLAVAALFLQKHHPVAALCLWAAALIAAAAEMGLELRYRRNLAVTGHAMAAVVLTEIGLLAAAIWLAISPPQTLAVENFAVYEVAPFADGTARFAALSQLPDGQVFLSPIDALILLKIRNGASGPRTIRDYRIEAWAAGAWRPLCRVSFAPSAPYYLFTPSRAREIALAPLALKGPDSTMAAGAASTFWSAWACPRKCDLAASTLRLVVTDQEARKERVVFPSKRGPDGAALPSGLDIGAVLDLDLAKEKIYGRDRCAGLTGARRSRAGALW